jgi:hypothetical protein
VVVPQTYYALPTDVSNLTVVAAAKMTSVVEKNCSLDLFPYRECNMICRRLLFLSPLDPFFTRCTQCFESSRPLAYVVKTAIMSCGLSAALLWRAPAVKHKR